MDELVDRYVIEGKFSGRTAGTTLYLVQAKARDGSLHQAVEGQRFKLFLVPRLSCDCLFLMCSSQKFIINYFGPSCPAI